MRKLMLIILSLVVLTACAKRTEQKYNSFDEAIEKEQFADVGALSIQVIRHQPFGTPVFVYEYTTTTGIDCVTTRLDNNVSTTCSFPLEHRNASGI